MPKITKETIEHVAKLARLDLTEQESTDFLGQLEEILNAFSELDEVNTDNVEPAFQPIEVKNVFREDKVEECLTNDEALENTEHREGGFIKGPKAV